MPNYEKRNRRRQDYRKKQAADRRSPVAQISWLDTCTDVKRLKHHACAGRHLFDSKSIFDAIARHVDRRIQTQCKVDTIQSMRKLKKQLEPCFNDVVICVGDLLIANGC